MSAPRSAIVVALCAGLLALAGGIGSAAAQSSGAVQSVPGTAALTGIACATATSCFAIGRQSGPTAGITSGTLVPITSGTAGAAESLPGELSGISCWSSGECLVVAGDSVIPVVDGVPGSAQVINETSLLGVSCSGDECIAVGSGGGGGGWLPTTGLVLPITDGVVGRSRGALI